MLAKQLRTNQEALARQYKIGEYNCALCGAPGVILYQSHGGWWCDEHRYIPAEEFSKNQESLEQGIKRFIDYHS